MKNKNEVVEEIAKTILYASYSYSAAKELAEMIVDLQHRVSAIEITGENA